MRKREKVNVSLWGEWFVMFWHNSKSEKMVHAEYWEHLSTDSDYLTYAELHQPNDEKNKKQHKKTTHKQIHTHTHTTTHTHTHAHNKNDEH